MGCSSSVTARARPQAPSQRPPTHNHKVKAASQRPESMQTPQDTETPEQPLQNAVNDGSLFEDTEFPATVKTLTKDTSNENYKTFHEAIWRRPPEIMGCGYDEIKIFDTIDVNDIAQGLLGNCYFLAALSGLAEEPERVKLTIQTSEINKSGKYSVRFYLRGVPTTITVDDQFPCYNYSPYEPLFSKPKGKELWTMLLEKAWAKMFKSYTNIEAGTIEEALEHLTGAPSFGFETEKRSDNEIWTTLKQADLKKFIVGAASHGDVEESSGIVGGHAYTMVSVHEVEGHKLVKLRNPWGQGEWQGDFSDSSSLWTESLKQAVGYENANNGMFFMKFKDFKKHFSRYSTHHCYDNWHYSYVEQKSGPKHANYYKFSVNKPCEAYFRIHQTDFRSYDVSQEERDDFKYSPASFMIVKVEYDGQYKLVLDSDVETDPNLIHGERTLYMTKDGKVEIKEEGDYIIRAKVLWRHGHAEVFTISAYSSEKIDLKPIPSVKDFQTKYFTLLANKNYEEQALTSMSAYVSGWVGGCLYIMVKNRKMEEMRCSLNFTELENLKLSKLNKVSEKKFTMEIAPDSSQLVFLKRIDPFKEAAPSWKWDL